MKPEGVRKKPSGGRGGNQVWLPKENTPKVVSTASLLILDNLSSWKISPHADESVIFYLKIRKRSFFSHSLQCTKHSVLVKPCCRPADCRSDHFFGLSQILTESAETLFCNGGFKPNKSQPPNPFAQHRYNLCFSLLLSKQLCYKFYLENFGGNETLL